MAKTFKDFMLECEAYPYSQQSFDLMKECSELSLMEHYLESQNYMMEHQELFAEGVSISEGYLTESADEASVETMTESFKEKAGAAWTTIKNGIKNLIRTFHNFMLRIANQFNETTKLANATRAKMAKMDLTDEQINQIQTVCLDARKSCKRFFPRKGQPYAKKIKFGKTNVADSPDEANSVSTRDYVAAALTPDVIICNVSGGNGVALLDDDLASAMRAFSKGGKGNYSGCLAGLKANIEQAKAKGIAIPVQEGHCTKVAEKLAQMQKELEGVAETNEKQAEAGEANNNVPGNKKANTDASDLKTINEIYTILNTSIGASVALYTDINKYRKTAVNGIAKIVGASSGRNVNSGKDPKVNEGKDGKSEDGKENDNENGNGENS